jgi:hypothetical protein
MALTFQNLCQALREVLAQMGNVVSKFPKVLYLVIVNKLGN